MIRTKPFPLARFLDRFAVLILVLFTPIRVAAQYYHGPLGSMGPSTLTEEFAAAHSVVLSKWVTGSPAKETDPGTTDFELVEDIQRGTELPKGSRLRLTKYHAGKAGELFLLLSNLGEDRTHHWRRCIQVTQTEYDYVKQLPKLDQPPVKRLAHFLKYLEHSDPMISTDAFSELDDASDVDVVKLAKELSPDKLRSWVTSTTVPINRHGLYAKLLGLCGTMADAKLLEREIFKKKESDSDEFGVEVRMGIEGVMSGYLMLAGENGLTVLDEKALRDKEASFSETYAAMRALRFIWEFGDNRIKPDRLRQSMRTLLERPELADLVIADLARMKDWSVQDRLMTIYVSDEYDVPSTKRAIASFMLASAEDIGNKADAAQPLPAHAIQAQKYLEELEIRDPKIVKDAKWRRTLK